LEIFEDGIPPVHRDDHIMLSEARAFGKTVLEYLADRDPDSFLYRKVPSGLLGDPRRPESKPTLTGELLFLRQVLPKTGDEALVPLVGADGLQVLVALYVIEVSVPLGDRFLQPSQGIFIVARQRRTACRVVRGEPCDSTLGSRLYGGPEPF